MCICKCHKQTAPPIGGCPNCSCRRPALKPSVPQPTQGWQCPCCRSVFAPSVGVCTLCNPVSQGLQLMGGIHTHRCPPKKES